MPMQVLQTSSGGGGGGQGSSGGGECMTFPVHVT